MELRFNDVAVRHLAASFQILADLERPLGLIECLLGGGILALGNDEAVIGFGDGA